MTITRLGQGVDATQRLRPDAMERTFAALRSYRAVMDAEGVGRVRLVATSAVRDSTNGKDFLLAAADIIGAPAELLPGSEEGRLSFAGATGDLPVGHGAIVVVDIGGGSTELVTASDEGVLSVSLDIGCVRLTERYLAGDPPTVEEVQAAVAAIATELDRAVQVVPPLADLGSSARLVGLAGTVSTLASLEMGLVEYDRDQIHHTALSAEAVARWCAALGAESVEQRAQRPGLPPGRQDVIFGGALVLREVMIRFGFGECIVSEADILDGLIMSLRDMEP